jgi:hypothetical protein
MPTNRQFRETLREDACPVMKMKNQQIDKSVQDQYLGSGVHRCFALGQRKQYTVYRQVAGATVPSSVSHRILGWVQDPQLSNHSLLAYI